MSVGTTRFQEGLRSASKMQGRVSTSLGDAQYSSWWRLQPGHLRFAATIITLLVERVVGFPLLSHFLFWRWSQGWQWWLELLSSLTLAILVSSLYTVSTLGSLIMVWLGAWLVRTPVSRRSPWLYTLLVVTIVASGMSLMGLRVDTRVLVYGTVQVVVMILTHYRHVLQSKKWQVETTIGA